MATPSVRFAGAVLASFLFLTSACRHRAQISDLTTEFVDTALSFSPSAATAAGLHQLKGESLDAQLDDFGPAAIDYQRRFYEDFNQRLQQLDPDQLNPQDRADLAILQDRVGFKLLELTQIRSDLHNPLMYVRTLGNALYIPYIVEFAPKAERFRDIASRLRQVPLLLDQAATNISSAPAVWCQAAIVVNQALIDLVDKEIRAAVPKEAHRDYQDASALALTAMRKFQDYLQNKLQYLDNADWRLGPDLYQKKFHLVLEAGGTPQDLLLNAEREFGAVRSRMYEMALPLHRALAPGHKDHAELNGAERQQRVIAEVLANLAGRHSTPESFMEDARRDIEESWEFVDRKHVIAPPANRILQVTVTPAFLRPVDPVGAVEDASPLQPQLAAFYWVAPFPPDWPKDRVESKLREYNFYGLKLRTMRDVMPGRFAQSEAANKVEPDMRRLLRTTFGEAEYIQGWEEYSMQTTVAAGFLDQSPELALSFAKEQLRVLADAILDVRLHTLKMTDQEALNLLENGAFEEAEEAKEKLELAKQTSCELPGYFVGAANWIKAYSEYQGLRGGSPGDFNDRALKQGAVPLSLLVAVLTQ